MARVQSAHSGSSSSTSQTATFGAGTSAGNLLVIHVVRVQAISSIQCSDSTVPTEIGTAIANSPYYNLQTFYVKNCAAGITSVTVTTGSADLLRIIAAEYSGYDTAAPYDTTSASGTGTSISTSVTTANDTDLLVAACIPDADGSSVTWGDSFTEYAADGMLHAADKTAGSAGSYSASATTGSTAVLRLAAFKAAAGGGGGGGASTMLLLGGIG